MIFIQLYLFLGDAPLDDDDEEMSKDVTDDENNVTSNSSEGQRSPPPSMVFGQPPPMGVTPIGPSGLPLSLMNTNMMYMTQYINPYLQVIIFSYFIFISI